MNTNPTDDFEVIYETDKLFGDYLKCKHCGQRVERGIQSVSDHWLGCTHRTDGIIRTNDPALIKLLDSWSINKP